jgi:hypothetical protein
MNSIEQFAAKGIEQGDSVILMGQEPYRRGKFVGLVNGFGVVCEDKTREEIFVSPSEDIRPMGKMVLKPSGTRVWHPTV